MPGKPWKAKGYWSSSYRLRQPRPRTVNALVQCLRLAPLRCAGVLYEAGGFRVGVEPFAGGSESGARATIRGTETD
jgi:hypothetical protein